MRNGLIVGPGSAQKWYLDDMRHREDGPAVVLPDGFQQWYQNDELHREDGPAVTYASGAQEWHLRGRLHRDGGPAVTWPDGSQQWYRRGRLYREDGPAIVSSRRQEWHLRLAESQISLADGVLSIDGESVELADPGSKTRISRILKNKNITPVGWLAELVK